MLISMLQGLSMSLADSVPGVSGGTVAFILGFYEKFLGALHDLIGKDRNLRRSAFLYLLKFSAGWAVGMISCVMILSKAFENNIYFLSSLFLGFTVSAIPLIIYEEKRNVERQIPLDHIYGFRSFSGRSFGVAKNKRYRSGHSRFYKSVFASIRLFDSDRRCGSFRHALAGNIGIYTSADLWCVCTGRQCSERSRTVSYDISSGCIGPWNGNSLRHLFLQQD